MSYLTMGRTVSALALSLALAACGGDDNDDEVNALEDRVSVIESRLSGIDTENDSLNDALDAIEARLDAIESDTSVSDELAEITALLDQIEDRLAALENEAASIYQIKLVNVTANQPLAPAAVMLHRDADYAWQVGAPASVGLETLAESGSPALLIEESTFAFDSVASDGILTPGASTTVEVEAVWREDLAITVVSMPVNTNDAFSGATGWNIAELEEGMSMRALLPIYDAGTEANTEWAATIPGPAGGGEGFNEARDDVDVVSRHPGVVSSDDGYADSALDQSHRFDQGAIYVTVTRLEAE